MSIIVLGLLITVKHDVIFWGVCSSSSSSSSSFVSMVVLLLMNYCYCDILFCTN